MKLKDHFDSNYRYIPAAARPPASSGPRRWQEIDACKIQVHREQQGRSAPVGDAPKPKR